MPNEAPRVRMKPEEYKKFIESDMFKQQMSDGRLSVVALALLAEAGIIDIKDETLLFEVEKSVNRRVNPLNKPSMDILKDAKKEQRLSSTAGMPVVGSAKPPFLRNLPRAEMYAQTVKEMEDRKAKSKVLFDKDFSRSIIHDARNVWCTPELMRTLVADPSYFEKVRAAMYPATVSYCERIFENGGRTYIVPYITVLNWHGVLDRRGESSLKKGTDEKDDTYDGRWRISTTFYLNNQGGIGAMTGSHVRVYDPSDFASRDAIKRYMGELERSWNDYMKDYVTASDSKRDKKRDLKKLTDFLEPYASGRTPIEDPVKLMKAFRKLHKSVLGADTENDFLDIRTGEMGYGTIRHNVKEARKYGNDWYKVLDVTSAVRNGEIQRVLIPGALESQNGGDMQRDRAEADKCLERLGERMLKEKGLVQEWSGYVEQSGKEEYERDDYSI